MIEKVTAYKSSDGKTFETIEEVQRHEIEQILIGLKSVGEGLQPEKTDIQIDLAAKGIVDMKANIVDILTTGPKSKSKARAINGGRKTRTPKAVPEDGKALL